MPYSRKFFVVSALVLLIAAFPPFFFSSKVFHHPRCTDKLNERWDWAIKEARNQGFKDGFWIGYSIKRLMDEYYYIWSTRKSTFSGNYYFHPSLKYKTLGEIIYGKDFSIILSDEEQLQLAAKKALAELEKKSKPQHRVWKDVGILFKFSSSSVKIPETIRLNNISMPFDSEGLPLFWLDKTEDEESIFLMSKLYKSSVPERLKKRILTSIGFHGSSDLVVPFLEKVVKSSEPESLRGRAASELEDHDTELALKILYQTAKNDRSFYVRKKAVYALEDMRLEGATDALIDIARKADNTNIRKKAISALADKASKKAAEALEDFAYEDDDTEVQKRAVYALEDLPGGQGIPYLIKIAKSHPKLIIRKKAIYCLGDSNDPRALQALIEILQKK